jgi:outer membrane protein OmpA-like peptidoglycan-associated protein
VIRHPGFPGNVTDIVVEFGNARYQSLMDRYIAGENVRDSDLRQAWENTTETSGVWSSPIYRAFFADVRAFNKTMPVPKRVRVLLGDPPIDWSAVTSPADEDMNDWRDAHFAWVVEQEVINRGHKALLFVGGAHISRKVILPNSLIHLLDRRFPRQTLVVSAIDITGVRPPVASRIRMWPIPSATEIRGTWLGSADVRDIGFGLSQGRIQDDVDAVLYLTADAFSDVPFRIDPQSAFGIELRRRRKFAEDTLPFRGAKIRFSDGSSRFTTDSEPPLKIILAELERDHGLELLVKAYADSTEPQVQELSEARAPFVRNWLVSNGVSRERLTPQGCGASRPMWDSDTDEHRAANRRAELVRMTKWSGCQPPESFLWQ